MKLKGNLSPDRINEAVTQVLDFSEKNGLNRDGRVRLSVALEEILLEYRERYGESVPFQLVVLNRNGNIHVCLRVWCERLDPLRSGTDILRRVLSRMDDAPTWEYRSGYNQIDFTSAVYSTMLKNLRFSWEYMRGQRQFFLIAVEIGRAHV